ncbi:MAG: hypothetical protein II733_02950 [Succinivibrio sp.]|nr:hypothetical protein [Succinivibrio sp.]
MSQNSNLRYVVVGYGGCILGYAFSMEQAKKAVWNYRGYVSILDQWK